MSETPKPTVSLDEMLPGLVEALEKTRITMNEAARNMGRADRASARLRRSFEEIEQQSASGREED